MRVDTFLEHPLRSRIHEAISKQPGILPRALAAGLDCNRSTVRYHLARMQTMGVIRVISSDKRVHLFLATMQAQEQDALAVLLRGRTWELARQVVQNPGQPQCDLTNNLQMSRKILRKYVNRLLRVGLVEEVEDPPFLTYFPTDGLRALVTAWAPASSEAEALSKEALPANIVTVELEEEKHSR